MYGTMQKKWMGGFTVQTIHQEEHTRLLKLYQGIKTGYYPLPTAQRSEYDFYLQHEEQNIFRFHWADSRGRALRETSKSDEARKLHQDLSTADGVMIFCDCYALAKGDTRANEIRRITALINKAFQELKQPISLSIILTKADFVDKFYPTLIDPLKGLISVIEVSPLVSGALIPVACGIRMVNTQMPVLFALQANFSKL